MFSDVTWLTIPNFTHIGQNILQKRGVKNSFTPLRMTVIDSIFTKLMNVRYTAKNPPYTTTHENSKNGLARWDKVMDGRMWSAP